MVFINHVLKFKYPLDSNPYVQKITTDKNVVKFSMFLQHVLTYFIGSSIVYIKENYFRIRLLPYKC